MKQPPTPLDHQSQMDDYPKINREKDREPSLYNQAGDMLHVTVE